MMENKMAWQEGYEHGYAAAMEHFNEACEQEYKDGYERGRSERNKEITKLTAERDAAISAIERSCKYCKRGNSCDDYDCITDRDDHWEWCGLSLESKTSDKGVEHD